MLECSRFRYITPILYAINFIFLSNINICKSEFFTSMVGMEAIFQSELTLSHKLRAYIELETQRLNKLNRIVKDLERHSQQAMKDVESQLGNPINAFLLIKKLTVDWSNTKNFVQQTFNQDMLMNELTLIKHSLPNDEDLKGAATAIFRLQDTYQLTAQALASASVTQLQGSPALTADECFTLGMLAYNKEDFYHALVWLKEALDRFSLYEETVVSRSVVLDYYAFTLYKQGNIKHALKVTNEWLMLEPDHSRALNNKLHYETSLAQSQDVDNATEEDIKNELVRDGWRSSLGFSNYEKLCRGEDTVVSPDTHLLTCQYVVRYPMYYLGPLKLETVYLSPWIAVYHDVLTDTDIKIIKQLSSHKLHRSGVFVKDDGTAGSPSTTDYRISKSAWIADYEHPLIARLTFKTHALHNLSTQSAEQFQVLNYGLGGHYEPHHDFAKGDEMKGFTPGSGNRISTVICYLSNVEAGGATVFPELGVKLWPRKGSCAVWFNMLRNGNGDERTQHAACPVLVGHKWVCNKWYHEQGQEFIRQCSLDPNE